MGYGQRCQSNVIQMMPVLVHDERWTISDGLLHTSDLSSSSGTIKGTETKEGEKEKRRRSGQGEGEERKKKWKREREMEMGNGKGEV